MKYIIEIEDEPLVRKSALHGEDAVYRAAGFKSFVFDKVGLEKLTPYCPANDESSYEQGIYDAWSLAQELDHLNSYGWEEVFGVHYDEEVFDEGVLSSYSYDEAFKKMQKYKESKHRLEIEKKMLDNLCDETGYSIEELFELIKRVQKNDA